jgi:hypothetical protein
MNVSTIFPEEYSIHQHDNNEEQTENISEHKHIKHNYQQPQNHEGMCEFVSFTLSYFQVIFVVTHF